MTTPLGIFKDTTQIFVVSFQIFSIKYNFSFRFPCCGIDHHLNLCRGEPQSSNVFTELQLYLESNKDQLDVANTKNV